MSTLFGLKIVSSPLALEMRVRFLVVCRDPRRRRRRWSVRREETQHPGCYQLANGTLVMHPDLIAKLPKD